MASVVFTDVLKVKVVEDDTEEDGSLFMALEATGGGALLVSGYVEAFF